MKPSDDIEQRVQQKAKELSRTLRERDRLFYGHYIDIQVPRPLVGAVIGRHGEMIKKIQKDSGVQVQFLPDNGTGSYRVAHIMGPRECCSYAAYVISSLMQTIREREEIYRFMPQAEEVAFLVPAQKCGLVIGRGGDNVKAICQYTGARVRLSNKLPPDGDVNFKIFVVQGSPQQIDGVKQLMENMIRGPVYLSNPYPVCPSPPGPVDTYNTSPHGSFGHLQAPYQLLSQNWDRHYQLWPVSTSRGPNNKTAYWTEYSGQPLRDMRAQLQANFATALPSPEVAQLPAGQPSFLQAWEDYEKRAQARGESPGGCQRSGAYYTTTWAEYYMQQQAEYSSQRTGRMLCQPPGPQ